MKKPSKNSLRHLFWMTMIATAIFFTLGILTHTDANGKPPKSKFYDFSDQVIDGELKKPTALYTNARKKVEFDRLLNLKKSFMPELMNTAKDKAFK